MQESIKRIQKLPLPKIINITSTEKYYLSLSNMCRLYLKDLLYIKATEMTSNEITEHLKLIGIKTELVSYWQNISNTTDLSKYAKDIPHINQFNIDKNNFIEFIKKFHENNSSNKIHKY